MKTLHIYRKILKNGVGIQVKNKKLQVVYPNPVWHAFPKPLHEVFADSLAYIATWHFPLRKETKVVYHFPHPLVEPLFLKILLYSLPMNTFEHENVKTSDVLKNLYNATFLTQFEGKNSIPPFLKVQKKLENKAILFFSFGKDSLLTYALLQELGLPVLPFFMGEPFNQFENANKKKLKNSFEKTIGTKIEFFPLSIGKLRDLRGFWFGWDIVLSQYAFVLLPYYFYHEAKYVFFGNEQSCNFFTEDIEGYLINTVFEQGVSGMQLLQNVPKLFSIDTHVGSLVEPIHEMFATYILHKRYPQIARFQLSCFSDDWPAKKKRWCGVCEKCAMMDVFFKALSIDPNTVGLTGPNMLQKRKGPLFAIFDDSKGKSAWLTTAKDEQLLAFYLAYKNGARGELISEFKRRYLKEVEKRKRKLISEYFGIHSTITLPDSLRKKTLSIFEKERKRALRYIKHVMSL